VLASETSSLKFASPVAFAYNPLDYAWPLHEAYLRRFGGTRKRVVFLGMNPGPFGMVQTGVPFGEVRVVRDWLQLDGLVARPAREHPRRPIQGLACPRSEVSGRRLWQLFVERFGRPEEFFAQHLVINYCPLAFLESTGRNRTPDKLPAAEKASLFAACDKHLRAVAAILQPQWLIGIGDFALARARAALAQPAPEFGRILHPSPASPAANRGWSAQAVKQLRDQGVWD
jgi:single-strand selective monofunctional uracil DNA glycosylase